MCISGELRRLCHVRNITQFQLERLHIGRMAPSDQSTSRLNAIYLAILEHTHTHTNKNSLSSLNNSSLRSKSRAPVHQYGLLLWKRSREVDCDGFVGTSNAAILPSISDESNTIKTHFYAAQPPQSIAKSNAIVSVCVKYVYLFPSMRNTMFELGNSN